LEEEEIFEGLYGDDETRTLEELWWPPELIHTSDVFSSTYKNKRSKGGQYAPTMFNRGGVM